MLEKQENALCMKELEEAIDQNDTDTRKVIAIAGGDGSLGTTIKHLRKSSIIDKAMQLGNIYFATLPYGTGNDGPQVFGWGASPLCETWGTDLESLMRDLITSKTVSLTLWNVNIDGVIKDAHANVCEKTQIMCYYYNIGLDSRIGFNLEKLRTSKRCCNQTLYFFLGIWDFFAGCFKKGHEPVDN